MVLILLLSLIVSYTDDLWCKYGTSITYLQLFFFLDDCENPDIIITDVALHISAYGVEELKQLLEQMQMEKNIDLFSSRPLKVVNYLRVIYLYFFYSNHVNTIN